MLSSKQKGVILKSAKFEKILAVTMFDMYGFSAFRHFTIRGITTKIETNALITGVYRLLAATVYQCVLCGGPASQSGFSPVSCLVPPGTPCALVLQK